MPANTISAALDPNLLYLFAMAFTITREGNSIRIGGRFSASAVYWTIGALNEGLQRGYEDYVLDFSPCETVFPDGLVPLSAMVDSWRSNGRVRSSTSSCAVGA